jgi:DNA-binding GntR family transcriptional regulator
MLQRNTLGDQLYRLMRRRLINGEITAGTHISQSELAHEMGVSRIPVRDALRRLEAEGLLVGDEMGRFAVVNFGLQDAEEVYAIRRRLETLAVELAILHGGPALAEDLKAILLDMEPVVRSGRADDYIELDKQFHFAIYESSKSPRLIKLIRAQWIGIPHLVPIKVEGRLQRSYAQHTALYERIAAADIEGACRVLDQHIESAFNELAATDLKRSEPHPTSI